MKGMNSDKMTVEVKGEQHEVEYIRVNNDVNGNPRYVVHFTDLGVSVWDYGNIKGLTKYRAKWFGGGYVFQSYQLEETLVWAIKHVQEHYRQQEIKVNQTVNKKLFG